MEAMNKSRTVFKRNRTKLWVTTFLEIYYNTII